MSQSKIAGLYFKLFTAQKKLFCRVDVSNNDARMTHFFAFSPTLVENTSICFSHSICNVLMFLMVLIHTSIYVMWTIFNCSFVIFFIPSREHFCVYFTISNVWFAYIFSRSLFFLQEFLNFYLEDIAFFSFMKKALSFCAMVFQKVLALWFTFNHMLHLDLQFFWKVSNQNGFVSVHLL